MLEELFFNRATLECYYAGQALPGVITSHLGRPDTSDYNLDAVVKEAFAIGAAMADEAMTKEPLKKTPRAGAL